MALEQPQESSPDHNEAAEPLNTPTAMVEDPAQSEKESQNAHHDLKSRRLWRQVLAVLSVGLLTGSSGAHNSLPAVALPELRATNTTGLHLSLQQATWFAGTHALSAMAGALTASFLAHGLGPRRALLLQAVPCAAGWVLLVTSGTFPLLLVGRALVGFTSGLCLSAAQVYIGEAASPEVRGRLVCINGLLVNLGQVMTYSLGAALSWRYVAVAPILVLVLPGALGLLWVPESPYWLLGRSRSQQARESLRKLRGNDKPMVERELQIISEACQSRQKALTWSELGRELRKPAVLAPFLTMEALFVLRVFSGIVVVLNYTVVIFQEAGSPLNAYLSAVVIGCVRALNSVLCVLFVSDRFGRKTLLLFSGVGCTVLALSLCAFLVGRHHYPDWDGWHSISWLPLPLLIMWFIAFDFGFARMGWVVHSEILPGRIRSGLSGVGVFTHYVANFLSVFSFPYIRGACTLGGAFGLYSIFSFLSLLLVAFFLPETKNRRLETIEAFYLNKFGKETSERAASMAMK